MEEDLKDIDLSFQEHADPKVIAALSKIGNALALIYKKLPVINIPTSYDVSVSNSPTVKIENFKDLQMYFQSLETRLMQTAHLNGNKETKIEFPPDKQQDILDALYGIQEGLQAIYNKPQMTPAPATHMSLNSLNGTYKATTLTIGTSATPLPTVPLVNRRSLIIYNNSANTIYLGGSTVAISGTGQGLPVPTATYSPPFDSGPNMPLYGIATVSSSVTVLETSDEASGR